MGAYAPFTPIFVSLGFYPDDTDLSPGYFYLKFTNNTGSEINELDVDYTIFHFNKGERSNSITLHHGASEMALTSVSSTTLTTTETGSSSNPSLESGSPTATITGLTIADGADYLVAWKFEDVSGTGGRDIILLDNIVLHARSNVAPLSCTSSINGSISCRNDNVPFLGQGVGGTAPYTYSWDFGDGSSTDATQNPAHRFIAPGSSFNVVLTVTDDASNTTTCPVSVSLPDVVQSAICRLNASQNGQGSLSSSATGGTGSLNTSWLDAGTGSTILNNQNTITGLGAGEYILELKIKTLVFSKIQLF